jgi:hypothetical protein
MSLRSSGLTPLRRCSAQAWCSVLQADADRRCARAGTDDILSTPEDVELLTEALSSGTVVAHTQFEGLSHLDFTWGMHAHTKVYPEVVRFLDKLRTKMT